MQRFIAGDAQSFGFSGDFFCFAFAKTSGVNQGCMHFKSEFFAQVDGAIGGIKSAAEG